MSTVVAGKVVVEEVIREYYYGICDGFSKHPFTFISKTLDSIPPDVVCVNRCRDTLANIKQYVNIMFYDYSKNINKLRRSKVNRDKLIKNYNVLFVSIKEDGDEKIIKFLNEARNKFSEEKQAVGGKIYKDIKVGSVICHTDGDKNHCGVVVGTVSKEKIEVVFCTTNPLWNSKSRELSDDEQKLFGFPNRGKITYFAPVIRSIDEVHYLGYDFPLHRTEELVKEFFCKKEKEEEGTR